MARTSDNIGEDRHGKVQREPELDGQFTLTGSNGERQDREKRERRGQGGSRDW